MTSTQEEAADFCVEQAIRLWTRRHSGTWSESDETELQTWLLAAPEHRVAYDKVARVWASTGALQGRFARTEPTPRSTRLRLVLAACAAVLAVALVIPLWHVSYDWWNGVPVRWVAPRGEPRAIELQDGTHIQLDADSELVVKLGARVRRVALVRGEALFSVVHDASKPFEVQVGPGRVTDLGTRFDIEKLRDSARISVFEGRVGVNTSHGEVLLTAGRSSGYDGAGILLPIGAAEDPSVLWPAGLRHFVAEPLSVVVERLARYHAVTFAFSDPRLRQLELSGTFRVTDLPLFLRTVSTALPVQARWTGPQQVEFAPRAASPDQGPERGANPSTGDAHP
jgi:transmembrane sensor